MAMERLRKRFSSDPAYLNEASMGLVTSEANPSGRFGPIAGYPVGSVFSSRSECAKARVHGKTIAGIHGNKRDGAYSICMSGGYEDDTDDGDFIIYTGTGGQVDPYSGATSQVQAQSFLHPDNGALAMNVQTRRPVRVIRGPNASSPYAPAAGYRYDGLYSIERAYLAKGNSGYPICRYELRRLPDQPPLPVIQPTASSARK